LPLKREVFTSGSLFRQKQPWYNEQQIQELHRRSKGVMRQQRFTLVRFRSRFAGSVHCTVSKVFRRALQLTMFSGNTLLMGFI